MLPLQSEGTNQTRAPPFPAGATSLSHYDPTPPPYLLATAKNLRCLHAPPPPPHTHTPPCLQAIYLTAATASYTQLRELLQHHLPRLAGEGWGLVWGTGRRTICCSCTPPPGEVCGWGGRDGPVQEGGHSAAVVAHRPRSPPIKQKSNQSKP